MPPNFRAEEGRPSEQVRAKHCKFTTNHTMGRLHSRLIAMQNFTLDVDDSRGVGVYSETSRAQTDR